MRRKRKPLGRPAHFARSGAVAGAVSTFIFMIIHDLFISDIWFSVVLMIAAGVLCGVCLGWTFALMVISPTIGSWVRYNGLFVMMLMLLGVASVLIYEPVTTVAALIEANEPPEDLFRQALPMTASFTLAMAVLFSLLYGRSWRHYGAILITCTVLILLLGLNVSAIGLVHVPSGSAYLIVELFALILALGVVYVFVFSGLERKRLRKGEGVSDSACRPPHTAP